MAAPAWKVTGQHYETCSCDFVCPCFVTQLQAKPSKGSCTFANGLGLAWNDDSGRNHGQDAPYNWANA